uniref:AP complex mu/sigma subunit domain-containing protein n=1 Tax=Equus asinus TaxID=9793 RepID=A0A8C4PQC1_EQUAS
MMRFVLLFSGRKLRPQKCYLAASDKQQKESIWELPQVVLTCKPRMCSFLVWRDLKVV